MFRKTLMSLSIMAISLSTSVAYADQLESVGLVANGSPATVNFKVANTDGTPLADTRVTVIHVEDNQVVYQGSSDKSGHVS
ncbi:hypothetical protein SAMN05444162_1274 [Paenibacillaceae bacterium GAS479]|nr:hypothetical protein SAMN05444162_1274 [Paenibacillaceae bacterium GAS479]